METAALGSSMSPRPFWTALLASFAVLAVAVVVAPLLGSTHIDYGRAWAGVSRPTTRSCSRCGLPRVLLALIAGGNTGAHRSAVPGAAARFARRAVYARSVERVGAGRSAGNLPRAGTAVWPSAVAGAAVTLVVVLAIAFESTTAVVVHAAAGRASPSTASPWRPSCCCTMWPPSRSRSPSPVGSWADWTRCRCRHSPDCRRRCCLCAPWCSGRRVTGT